MKRLKFLSVIMIIVTLFFMGLNINVSASSYNIDSSLRNKQMEVDEIFLKEYDRTTIVKSNTYSLLLDFIATNPADGEGYRIERKRYVYGEFNSDYIKTEAILRSNRGFKFLEFNLYYDDILRISVSISTTGYGYRVDNSETINFNDPNNIEYENYTKCKLATPTTKVFPLDDNNNYNLPDSTSFGEYEDIIAVRSYNILGIKNIKEHINFLSTKQELIKSEITLDTGLVLNNKTNEYYGGDYELDEYGYISEGKHYLKILLIYDDTYYEYIYEIKVLPMILDIPDIYTTIDRQVTESEIFEQINKTGIENYVIDTNDYYKNYNKVGKYYVEVKYIFKHKEYIANLFINVCDIGDNKFKLRNPESLTVGYKDELDLSNLEEIFNFSYFYLDECYADIKEYEINKNIPGEYKIHIIASATNGELYIQTYNVNVIDNEKPIINITSDTKLEYSYIDSIDIDSIINTLDIIDISSYEVDYNADSFINNLNKPGLYPLLIIVKDEFLNESTMELELNIIDDIKPKLVLNDIYVNKGNKLEEQFIKSNIYAYDEIDGKLNNDNIVINDINGYKYNYDIPGIYKFEVSAKDNMQNEAYGSFNIIVNKDEIEESKDNKIIKLNRNNRLTQNELLLYLIDRNYISADIEYEIVSDYFNDEILKDEYSLVLKNGEELSNFEIQIIDSDINYEKANEDIKINNTNNITLIITLAIIASLITIGIILVIIIYKKRH